MKEKRKSFQPCVNAATKYLLDFKPTTFRKAVDMSSQRTLSQNVNVERAFYCEGRCVISQRIQDF